MEYIHNHVRFFRKSEKLSQNELSKNTGIAQSTISEIENGTHIPNLFTALLLSRALNATVNELFVLCETGGNNNDGRRKRIYSNIQKNKRP